MSDLTGIFVSLDTSSESWAGTDDHLYLGVVGTVGGREFALDVAGFDDFEEKTTVTYSIGPAAALFGGKKPATADAALADMTICLPNVTHVYLRKQGDRTHDGDDAWRLDYMYVYLVSSALTRVFESTGPATLGNEFGQQIWLGEGVHGKGFRDMRLVDEGISECIAHES